MKLTVKMRRDRNKLGGNGEGEEDEGKSVMMRRGKGDR